MLDRLVNRNNVIGMVLAGGLSALTLLNATPVKAEDITAGSLEKGFSTKELNAYLTGMIDGFKYSRYEKEGNSTEGGWRCIHHWFYEKDDTMLMILTAFRKFKDHHPNAVMAALIKRECGE